MNRINPLYVGLLLLVVLALSVFELNSSKSELYEAEASYDKTAKLAVELSELKKLYASQKNMQMKLKRILAQNVLRNAGIVASYKKSRAKISAETLDKTTLDFLMAKILNSPFNIDSFEIRKLSENKASFKMEIKW